MATDINQRSEKQGLLATPSDTESLSSAAESAAEDNGDERSRLIPTNKRPGNARGMLSKGRIEEEMSVLRETYLNKSFPEDADDEDSVTAEMAGSTGPSVLFKRQKSPLHGNKLAKGDPGEDTEFTENLNQSKVLDDFKKISEATVGADGPKDIATASTVEGIPDFEQNHLFAHNEGSAPREDALLTTDNPNKQTAHSTGNVYKPEAKQVKGETTTEGDYRDNPQVEGISKRPLDRDDDQIEKEATPLLSVEDKPLVYPKAGEFQVGQAGGAKGFTKDENLTMAAQDGGDSSLSRPGVAKLRSQRSGVSAEGEGTVVLEDDDGRLAYYETAVADEYGYLHKHGFPLLKETSKTLTINNPTLKHTSSSYKKNDPTIREGEYHLVNPGLDLKHVPSTYSFSKPERKTIPTSYVHQVPVIKETIKTYQKNIPESLRVESTYTRNIPIPKEIPTTYAKSVPIKKDTPTTFKKTVPQLRLSSSTLNYSTPSLKSIGSTYNFTTPILEESQLQSTHSLPALFQTQSSYSKSTPSLKNISLTLLKSTPSLLEVQHNFVHNKPRLRQPERVVFSNSLPEIHKPAIPPSMRHNNPVFREEPPAIWLFNTPEKEVPETVFFDFKPVLEAPVITHLHPAPMLTTGDAEHVFELNEPVLDE
ncbi:Hypp1288 [Branchiostoma lanceolatum]|uniref:Hypp1288 protein n=1 Tax=Branchiostoma lanceolatum TaxID=7740 RepID=A0A8J9ZG30_BRALA|nr:Hypp1288 [Branchiostoma lanceolatum]